MPNSGRRAPASRTLVAVADDDEVVRESLAAVIEAHGFHVLAFASGRELLDGHAAERADCILLDHHMPEINGLEVLRTLRDRGDSTPAIIVTGVPDNTLHAKARMLGAFAVLFKPASPAELMIAVHGALAMSKR